MNDQEKILTDLDQTENTDDLNKTLNETKKESFKDSLKAEDISSEEILQEAVPSLEDEIASNAENTAKEQTEEAAELLTIGSIDPISDTLSINESKAIPDDYDTEGEEIEVILPPDEIFAVTSLLNDKSENENEVLLQESIDEDGQYRIPEIEAPFYDENDDEETLEIDYSEPVQEKYNDKKPRQIDGKFDFIELFVFTFLAVILVTSFLFKHSVVDGVSMESTLYGGEHLIISDFFYTPKRGDIIVCEDYSTTIEKPIVKRVIAIEGDTVWITMDGRIYVNDVLLEEDYVFIDDPTYKYRELTTTVGKNELFVMGDHRNASTDSRVFGTVSEDSVLGKVILRFYPLNKFGPVN